MNGTLRMGGFVRITNQTGKKIIGRYDGEDYEFLHGEPVDVPEPVAAHVFGFGVPDKAAVLARLGWATTSDMVDEGLQKLGRIKFEDIVVTAQAVVDDDDSPAAGDSAPGNDSGAVGPRSQSGGDEGGGSPPPETPRDVI
jgi:hypothetical protein